MLTSDDIKLIIEAEKEFFPTKDDFLELKNDFSRLQTSVDGYAVPLRSLILGFVIPIVRF